MSTWSQEPRTICSGLSSWRLIRVGHLLELGVLPAGRGRDCKTTLSERVVLVGRSVNSWKRSVDMDWVIEGVGVGSQGTRRCKPVKEVSKRAEEVLSL